MSKKPMILTPSTIEEVQLFTIKPKGYTNILEFFRNTIIEMYFWRKTDLPNPKTVGHMKKTRRMLCTADWNFLKIGANPQIFNWHKPKESRGYQWYKNKNLIIVWDFLQNDYRIVSLKDWKILSYLPLTEKENAVKFLGLYQGKLKPGKMQKQKRDKFSDR